MAGTLARVLDAGGHRGVRPADVGAPLILRTEAFDDGQLMPSSCSRDGGNQPPTLTWSDLPDGTAEIELLLQDLDADDGSSLHWLLTGMMPAASGVSPGSVAGARVWANDFGARGYSGPRPPVGEEPHRYGFRVYALPRPLGLPAVMDPAEVHERLEQEAAATGTLVGLYRRECAVR